MVIGTCTQPLFIRGIRDKGIKAGGKAPPESRLLVGMAGAVLAPLGLIWFALSSFRKMPWIMPMIGTLIFGVGVSYTCPPQRNMLTSVRVHLHERVRVPRSHVPQVRGLGDGRQHSPPLRLGGWLPPFRLARE